MCGIGGIFRLETGEVDRDALAAMQEALGHRGPDGQGLEVLGHGRCGMAHTRLSVVDLMGGHQPMRVPQVGEHGELTLVFNGEIYNHRRLRKLLERRGHRFESDHCDTEVLLHGYRAWGLELPKHLHGMWAFAVYDARHESLYLCRDRTGKKPLYVHRADGRVTFASVVSALTAALPSTPAIDRRALGDYLTFGYTFGQSLLEGVSEVPAGHGMLIESDGRTQTLRYWQPPPLSRTSTSLGAAQAIEELLEEAVTSRLEADVPLGCFLSGGIDSSLIAAMAAKHLDGPLRTFSMAMDEPRYDESRYATEVAEHIGARHHTLRAGGAVMDDLAHLIGLHGEPIADSSLLPSYWLSKATRQHVTVVLSGDGGDELFGGYDRYRALRLIKRFGGLLRRLPAELLAGGEPKGWPARLARLARAARRPGSAAQYLDMIRLFSPGQLGRMGLGDLPVDDGPPGWVDENDPAEAARRWDLDHYMKFDLLRKVDRASMAVALEVRCPMLDTQVCDLAGHLPLSVLMAGGRPKGLLRRVAAGYLPPKIVRRRKMGFALPIGRMFRGELADPLSDHLRRRALADVMGVGFDRIVPMLDAHRSGRADHSHRLFALLSLSIWLDSLGG